MISSVKNLIETYYKIESCSTPGCESSAYLALSSLYTCDGCSRRFCKKCISKTNGKMPEILRRRPDQANLTSYFICHEYCRPIVINYFMEVHREEMQAKYQGFIDIYLSSGEKQQLGFYAIPNSAAEDTAYRYALRVAKVAEVAATVSGYSVVYSTLKYLYYGSELVNHLIAGDLLTVMGPIMETMTAFGIKGPTGVLNCYYLGCKQVLDYKCNPSLEAECHTRGRLGVVSETCPIQILDMAGNFMSAAQWLYAASLPAPHDDNEWSSWYLSRIAAGRMQPGPSHSLDSSGGWTVIACVNETTKLPDGTKCPAFALLVRNRAVNSDSNTEHSNEYSEEDEGMDRRFSIYLQDAIRQKQETREAILSIRGSASTMDWSINLNETPDPFIYYASAKNYSDSVASTYTKTSEKPVDNSTKVQKDMEESESMGLIPVHGFVHRGMRQGALGILNSFAMRTYLTTLSSNGYAISVVGHSLGAGVAAVVAAELQNGYSQVLRNAKVRAMCYACPPCVSEEISVATAVDGLILSCIKWGDAVPRFSRTNAIALAGDVAAFTSTAAAWRQQDVEAAKAYAGSVGKAADMTSSSTTRPTTAPATDAHETQPSDTTSASVLITGTAALEATTVVSSQSTENTANNDTNSQQTNGISCVGVPIKVVMATQPAVVVNSPSQTVITDATVVVDANPPSHVGVAAASASAAVAAAATSFRNLTSSRLFQRPSNTTSTATSTSTTAATVTATATMANTATAPVTVSASAPVEDTSTSSSSSSSSIGSATFNSYLSRAGSALSTFASEGSKAIVKASGANLTATANESNATSANTSNSKGVATTGVPAIAMNDPVLVVPGLIIQLYRCNGNASSLENNLHNYGAAVIDYRHESLSRIPLLLDRIVDEHKAQSYRNSLREVKLKYVLAKQEHELFLQMLPILSQNLLDSSKVISELLHQKYLLNSKRQRDIAWKSLCLQGEETSESNGCAVSVEQQQQRGSVSQSDNKSNEKLDNMTKMELDSKTDGRVPEEFNHMWRNCSVCGIDVNWPFILRSSANRAIVAQNCSCCGRICCCYCAPAGEAIPGEGVNTTITLPDHRINSPSFGRLLPERTCAHCYLDSYSMI